MQETPALELMNDSASEGQHSITMEGIDEVQAAREEPEIGGELTLNQRIDRISTLYKNCLLSEHEIPHTSEEILTQKIDYLSNLRNLCVQQSSTTDNHKLISLMQRIGRDIELYVHFLQLSRRNSLETFHIESDILEECVEQEPVGDELLLNLPSGIKPQARQVSVSSIRTVESIGNSFGLFGASENSNSNSVAADKIFSWNHLSKISQSLGELQQGFASSFFVYSGIAIGMTNSVVLLFNSLQEFQGKLGNEINGPKYGAVSCINISRDMTQLVAGYSRGFICVFDIQKKSIIKCIEPSGGELSDGHIKDTPIVAVSIPATGMLISADMNGNAFFHTFISRILYTIVHSQRIHGRSIKNEPRHTTIHCMKASPFSKYRYPGDTNLLVAVATPFKLAIMAMKPTPQIVFRATWSQLVNKNVELKQVAQAQLSWWFPTRTSSNHNSLLLAVSFSKYIKIIRISWKRESNGSKKLKFDIINAGECRKPIAALNWITSQFISIVTTERNCLIFDSTFLQEIESTDLKYFKFTDNRTLGGSVSIDWVGSPCTYMNRLFILTDEGVWFAGILKWNDRLGILVKNGLYEEAFSAGVELFHGKYTIAVVGLPKDANLREIIVGEHLVGHALNFCSMLLSNLKSSKVEVENMCELVLRTMIEIRREDIVFDELWDRFEDSRFEHVFLNTLREFVIAEKLDSVPNATIVKKMAECSEIESIEPVFIALDPRNIDINQALSICKQKMLWSALIHIYNQGMNDFVTPFVDILKHISQNPENNSSVQYILFVYLAYSMTGRKYPVGNLSEDIAASAATELFRHLFSVRYISLSISDSEYEIVRVGNEPWPYFAYLINLDYKEMLNVVGELFKNELLDSGITSLYRENGDSLLITRQYILNVLLHLNAVNNWTPAQHDYINSFVGRCVYNYASFLAMTNAQLMPLFNSLIKSQCEETKKLREQAAILMYKSNFDLFRIDVDRTTYLEKFEKCGFWNLYRMLIIEDKNYKLAVLSYTKDQSMVSEFFEAAISWINADVNAKVEIYETILANINSFIRYPKQLVDLGTRFWPNFHSKMAKSLQSKSREQFEYLREVFLLDGQIIDSIDSIDVLFVLFIELKCKYDNSKLVPFLERSKQFNFYNLTSRSQLPQLKEYFSNYGIEDAEIWTIFEMKFYDEGFSKSFALLTVLLHQAELDGNFKDLKLFHEQFIGFVEKYCDHRPSIWEEILENICFHVESTLEVFEEIKVKTMTVVMQHIEIPDILRLLFEKNEESLIIKYKSSILHLIWLIEHQIKSAELVTDMTKTSLFWLLKKYFKHKTSAFYPLVGQCQLCRRLLHVRAMSSMDSMSQIVLFPCHHAFHENCLKRASDRQDRIEDISNFHY